MRARPFVREALWPRSQWATISANSLPKTELRQAKPTRRARSPSRSCTLCNGGHGIAATRLPQRHASASATIPAGCTDAFPRSGLPCLNPGLVVVRFFASPGSFLWSCASNQARRKVFLQRHGHVFLFFPRQSSKSSKDDAEGGWWEGQGQGQRQA
jgi:hypothetical protein